jgi:dCMP deaminase
MGSAYLSDAFFMKWADDVSKASTCCKIQVGSVLVREKRVLSLGYNGTPSGMSHCSDFFVGPRSREALGEDEFMIMHRKFSDSHELHSESSCLTFAWRSGITVDGATIYTQYSPCFNCSKLIIQARLLRVVYRHVYDAEAIEFLKLAKIQVDQIKD